VAGDTLSLTVTRGSGSRRIEVAVPPASAQPRWLLASYVVNNATLPLALVIGTVLAWRRTASLALRALALTALLSALDYPYSAPASAHFGALDFAASVASSLAMGVAVFFALNYPDDRPTGWRARLQRLYPPLFALHAAAALVHYSALHAGSVEPVAAWAVRAADFVAPALFFAAIALAWREARGETRQRLNWIVATLGLIFAAQTLVTLNLRAGQPIPAEALALAQGVAILVGEIGFVWAVLRHHVVDLGLAVNRALIFTIVGAIVFAVIQGANQAAVHFLQFDDRLRSALISGVLAVTAYLSIAPLKRLVERAVDRFFFADWVQREAALQAFGEHAELAVEPATLHAGGVAAIDDFSGRAGCALYLADDDGGYRLAHATLVGAPAQVSGEDEALLALRAHDVCHAPARHSALACGALALPLQHRRQLTGFVLLGPRPDGAPFRPDQQAALLAAARRLAANLHALQVGQLQRRLAQAEAAAATLHSQLEVATQMRLRHLAGSGAQPKADRGVRDRVSGGGRGPRTE
jgi:hypothetical protein